MMDEKRYPAAVLATLLGGNMSSLLFQEVREKRGLCYYIGASHYAHPEDGIFLIRA
jgi:predicted Zn-dependent peptidase